MNADHAHDHHVQPTQPDAAVPEATHGRVVGSEPLADTDPLKDVPKAEKASSLATVGIGVLVLLALVAATALLLIR